jgi:hypothetical protein
MEVDHTQPQEQMPTSTPNKPVVGPKKPKLSPIMYILITLVLMAATGFGVYYYMNNQQQKTEQANLKNITDLQNNVKTLNKKVKTTTSSSTSNPSSNNTGSSVQTSVHAVALKTFCQGTNPDTLVGSMQYVENTNGFFGLCGISSKSQPGTGGMLVAYYSGGKWIKVWGGNGAMEQSLCTKYKIPTSIYPDCTGNY